MLKKDEYQLPGIGKIAILNEHNSIQVGNFVVCKQTNIDGVELKFVTKGKKYQVIEIHKYKYDEKLKKEWKYDCIYQIVDDGDHINSYPHNIFESIQENRLKKIQNIIE